ncbi:MAG: drug/metabolite transporter (DMT)-like permease [Arcticibacterium sp.]|jgi:drug/metabolite transporter (DMT)-like permease
MIYLLLSILFSVILLINFRVFPKYGISTLQAIAFNYPICFITGLVLMPEGQSFSLNLAENWTWFCLALGLGFIITFILSGLSTQKAGMTATSLANNLSLVIPVAASLYLYNTQAKAFDLWNYLGLMLALIAVGLSTYEKSDGSVTNKNGWYLPLAVFLMYGITNAAINYLNLNFIPKPELTVPVTLVMVLGAVVSGLLLLVYRLIRGQEKLAFKNVMAGITLGVPNFLSFYLLILALTAFGNSGAFVYPIFNMGVIIVSALVGISFFKEKLSNINKLGLTLGLIAILLISYQDLSVF